MNIAIIDDLLSNAEVLQQLINSCICEQDLYCQISIFTNEKSFFQSNNNFSAIFLDILMPDINGIDLAKKIRETNPDIPIIFVTTEKEYALLGYEVQAFDYLLKPPSRDKIFSIIKRLALINGKYTITLKIKAQNINVPVKNILYAQSRGHNVDVYTTAGKYTVYMPFKDFLTLVPNNKSFFVYTRGAVVNFDNILKMTDISFILTDNTSLHISRSKLAEIKKSYTNYIFSKTRGELN